MNKRDRKLKANLAFSEKLRESILCGLTALTILKTIRQRRNHIEHATAFWLTLLSQLYMQGRSEITIFFLNKEWSYFTRNTNNAGYFIWLLYTFVTLTLEENKLQLLLFKTISAFLKAKLNTLWSFHTRDVEFSLNLCSLLSESGTLECSLTFSFHQ